MHLDMKIIYFSLMKYFELCRKKFHSPFFMPSCSNLPHFLNTLSELFFPLKTLQSLYSFSSLTNFLHFAASRSISLHFPNLSGSKFCFLFSYSQKMFFSALSLSSLSIGLFFEKTVERNWEAHFQEWPSCFPAQSIYVSRRAWFTH